MRNEKQSAQLSPNSEENKKAFVWGKKFKVQLIKLLFKLNLTYELGHFL